MNGADNPAPAGSTITLFATGLGATEMPVAAGSIARTATITPKTALFSTWQTFPAGHLSVTSLPGFVSAMFQVDVPVPASLEYLHGTLLGNGVQQVSVGLTFNVPLLVRPRPPYSNYINVYLKE